MSISKSKEECLAVFEGKFGTSSVQLSAPGRANIIGEHTDYNQGFVLPFAINKYIHFFASKSSTKNSQIVALNLNEEVTLTDQPCLSGFGKFLQACLIQVKKKYPNDYFVNLVFGGDLPIGAGISSSSALCCGFLVVLSKLYDLNLNQNEILEFAITAERGVAVEGGIMDQFSIINGMANHAILLDCLDNSTQYIPFNFKEHVFCIFDSRVEHNLAETAYGDRVNTCKNALQKIKQSDSTVTNFRNLNIDHLELLEGKQRDRIEHVIKENERTLLAVDCLKNQDAHALGVLLNITHESLRDFYEVSCIELDFIAEHLQGLQEVAGARMMGGGFGGSVIGLVKKGNVEKIGKALQVKYFKQFALEMRFFAVESSNGLIANL